MAKAFQEFACDVVGVRRAAAVAAEEEFAAATKLIAEPLGLKSLSPSKVDDMERKGSKPTPSQARIAAETIDGAAANKKAHRGIKLPNGWFAGPVVSVAGAAATSGGFMFGKEGPRKLADMVFNSAMETFTPLGSEGNLAAEFTPSTLRPLTYIYTNLDWAGRPVHANPEFREPCRPELSGHRDPGLRNAVFPPGLSRRRWRKSMKC